MKVESRKWIELAKDVCNSPFKKWRCPKSSDHFITVNIVPWPNEEPKIDIHLICEECEIRNVFTKKQ